MADRNQPPPSPRRKRSIDADKGDAGVAPEEEPRPEADSSLPFEVALDRLEVLVAGLEDGELSLEEALAGFEEGVRLSRRLADRLADAERRVERLTREGGVTTTRPLRDDEGPG